MLIFGLNWNCRFNFLFSLIADYLSMGYTYHAPGVCNAATLGQTEIFKIISFHSVDSVMGMNTDCTHGHSPYTRGFLQ